jgi:hypothetical protein
MPSTLKPANPEAPTPMGFTVPVIATLSAHAELDPAHPIPKNTKKAHAFKIPPRPKFMETSFSEYPLMLTRLT